MFRVLLGLVFGFILSAPQAFAQNRPDQLEEYQCVTPGLPAGQLPTTYYEVSIQPETLRMKIVKRFLGNGKNPVRTTFEPPAQSIAITGTYSVWSEAEGYSTTFSAPGLIDRKWRKYSLQESSMKQELVIQDINVWDDEMVTHVDLYSEEYERVAGGKTELRKVTLPCKKIR